MFDIKGKTYDQMVELRKNAIPDSDPYRQLTDEINRIQQDTNNIQTADLVGQIKNLNTGINSYSNSSNKAAAAMIFLTVGLLVLAFAQSYVAYLSYISNRDLMRTREDCYKSVLQTSDIDLNYRNCLRNHGLSD